MSWSDLQPPVRAAILAGVAILVIVLIWTMFVSPMRLRATTAERDLATAEQQLEATEREIESIPPASEAERAAWQASRDELLSRLGPESELPLLLESLARLAETQEVEIFVTSGSPAPIGAADPRSGTPPSASDRVFGTVPGAGYVPLNVRVYGDYEDTGRFISQIGRLGWATAFRTITMTRQFPEITTDIGLDVYFRPSEDGNGSALGVQGGGGGGRG